MKKVLETRFIGLSNTFHTNRSTQGVFFVGLFIVCLLPCNRANIIPSYFCHSATHGLKVTTYNLMDHRHSSPLIATHRHSSPLIATHRHSSPLIATHRHSSPLIAAHRHSPHPKTLCFVVMQLAN
jgi:hypothetical protein